MLPGTRIGRFEVEETLGQGGIATVYRVRHTQLDTRHALKLLRLDNPGLARRMVQEGRIQARLQHPNVVAVTDLVEYEGGVGLLMELVQGQSLERLLEQGALPVDRAMGIFRQVLAAVAAAHAAGITHRDLKPANILLSQRGDQVVAKVTDFGIAKVLSQDELPGMTRAGTAMGTPGYMAPEQILDSASTDHRADVFALGVILYELLAGEGPFRADDALATMNRTVSGAHPPLPLRRPEVPLKIAAAVRKAMATDRERRFQDCESLAQALDIDLGLVAAAEPQFAPVYQLPPPTAPTLAPTGTLELDALPRAVAPLPTPAPAPTPTPAPASLFRSLETVAPAEADPGSDEQDEEPISRLSMAWGQAEDPAQAAAGAEPEDRAEEDEEEEEEQEKEEPPDPNAMSASEGGKMMLEMFTSFMGAVVWGFGKALRIGGVPLALCIGGSWWLGERASDRILSAAEDRSAQSGALRAAMDSGVHLVPLLVEAGADAELLRAQQSRYENAVTVEEKLEAARALSSVMNGQLSRLPATGSAEQQEKRRRIELALARIEEEAARYEAATERDAEERRSMGGRIALALGLVPGD